MAKKELAIKVKVDGYAEISKALRKLPPEALEKLIDASWELSGTLAKGIRAAARATSRQAGLLASTVETDERVHPAVTIGGTARVGRNHKPAYKVLFGAEFGAKFLRQFRVRNTGGYFIFPTVREQQASMVDTWVRAANQAIDDFGKD
jgi:hypothetical protein